MAVIPNLPPKLDSVVYGSTAVVPAFLLDPGDAKTNDGFIVEPANVASFNYWVNRHANAIGHIAEHGVSVFDSNLTYNKDFWTRSDIDGQVYTCINSGITGGPDPSADGTNFVLLSNFSNESVAASIQTFCDSQAINGNPTTLSKFAGRDGANFDTSSGSSLIMNRDLSNLAINNLFPFFLGGPGVTLSIIGNQISIESSTTVPVPGGVANSIQTNNGTGGFSGQGTFTFDNTNVSLDDNINLTFGDFNALTLGHNGTDSTITNNTGKLIIDNSLSSATIQVLFKTGQSINFIGAGQIVQIKDAGLVLSTGKELILGNNDLIATHNGTDTTITNNTGNLIIDNTNVTGSTILKLGTTDDNTVFQIQDDSDSIIIQTLGDGTTNIPTNRTLSFGDSDTLTITNNGPTDLITSTAGVLLIDNTNVTGSTIFKLGAADGNTVFIFQDSASSSLLTIDGTGKLNIGGSFGIKRFTTTVSDNTAALGRAGIYAQTGTLAITITISTIDIAEVNRQFIFKDEGGNAGTNNITITPQSGLIDGAATATISTDFGNLTLYTNGANLFVI